MANDVPNDPLVLIALGAVGASAAVHSALDAPPALTAFTYQGYLEDGGSPANGAFDLQFKLFDAAIGGSQLGTIAAFEDVTVTDGVFSVLLDFGVMINGASYIETGIRYGNSTGEHTTLSPRQELTPAPFAANADLLDGLDATAFATRHFLLLVLTWGSGNGTVASTPAGIACGDECIAAFDPGSLVTLTATADANSAFVGWSDACMGSDPCTVTVDASKLVHAKFVSLTQTLALSKTGSGDGTVTSQPMGIFCGAACSAEFDADAVVALTASPDSDSVFAGWSGACAGTDKCSVTMDVSRNVTASFTRRYILTAGRAGSGDGTVSSAPGSIDCGSTCSASFDAGTTVTLNATPNSTSLFAGWSGACAGTGGCTVAMDASKNVTAVFTRNAPALTVAKTGTGGGTVSSSPPGIDCGSTCSANYTAGASVNLTAIADATSTFAGWSGACSGTGMCTVTMDAARSVTATFTRRAYTLTLTRTDGGTIISSPANIYCGAACSASYDAGTTVTLTATPDATATFTGWSGGGCSGTGPCTVSMDAAKTVAARFTFQLFVLKAGAGGGSVTSTPSGIDCGTSCATSFDGGTLVTLTAVADGISGFTGWSGACSGTGDCIVTMSEARSVTASFTRVYYALTANKTGTGGGMVTSSPTGINCGSTCSASYVVDTSVTLTATADGYSTFAGWSGACSSTSTCTVSMDAAKNITASFIRRSYTLTVNRTGPGTVTSSAGGIFCGAACSGSYDAGTTVILTATPDTSATFSGWGGGCSGTGTCTVTLDAAKTVAATFVVNTYVLSVPKSGTGTGRVISTPAGIDCGSTCSTSYDSGTVVTLSAAPASDSTFTGWSGACSGAGACTTTMSAARNVTATFTKNSYMLVVGKTGTGGGTVTSSTGGINCGATCSSSYQADTSVTLTATADGYSTFAGWSGACSGTSTCTVTMDAAKSVSATFTRRTYVLTVSRTGGGTITSSPLGIYCGAACSAPYDAGIVVTLTATPDASATFAGWSGGGCSGTGTCTVTMDATKTVSARFTFPLTVMKDGTGSGYVTSSPAGISCGTTCTMSVDGGTVVTLTASPDGSSTFAGWSGACSGTGTCVLSLDAAKSVTATFNPQ